MASLIERFQKEWMTLAEARAALRCSRSTVLRRVREQVIVGREINGRTFVERASIERFLKACLSGAN